MQIIGNNGNHEQIPSQLSGASTSSNPFISHSTNTFIAHSTNTTAIPLPFGTSNGKYTSNPSNNSNRNQILLKIIIITITTTTTKRITTWFLYCHEQIHHDQQKVYFDGESLEIGKRGLTRNNRGLRMNLYDKIKQELGEDLNGDIEDELELFAIKNILQ